MKNKIVLIAFMLFLVSNASNAQSDLFRERGVPLKFEVEGYKYGAIQWQSFDPGKGWSDIQDADSTVYLHKNDSTSVLRYKVSTCPCNPYYSDSIHIYVKDTDKLDWWREAHFGMFIHWGVYSALAGEYKGENVYGQQIHFQTIGNRNTPSTPQDPITLGKGAPAEWIMREAMIPRKNYKTYASQFTAASYDPKKIAALAKSSGMKYVVLTAKHHDGFCLWNTKQTDWQVSNTPAGQKWNNDLIKPLAEAVRAEGLKFGIYFSQARDWMYEGGLGEIPELGNKKYSLDQNAEYMEKYTYPMIQELLENYHPDIFWWDAGYDNTSIDFARRCQYLVNKFDPRIITNDRLANSFPGYGGDFITPEQTMDEKELHGDFEMCLTTNDTWGYNQFDESFKSSRDLLYTLMKTSKLGGNLLLNIGPMGDGTVPPAAESRLNDIGNWLNHSGKAVYGSIRNPFVYSLPWGMCTKRIIDGKTHLFYNVFYWDGTGELLIPGLLNPSDDIEAYILKTGQKIEDIEAIPGIGLKLIGLPKEKIDELCTTIELIFKNDPNIEEGNREFNNQIDLRFMNALSKRVALSWSDDIPCLCWFAYNEDIEWKLIVQKSGTYKISMDLASDYSGEIQFNFNDNIYVAGKNHSTPGGINGIFQVQDLGTVTLPEGTYTLKVKSIQDDSWIKFHNIILTRL
ncbi:alpha-L-fucosidase [uncultured Bacteroides sp.]|uniref:alpha-L-fucosidase n=1 Tax=uncultured Bacteroides sp. TaxID=162156 RepID=UPI002AAACE25|nr:alpha-L-fucosidase [uncultured Bacteroides sp.]